MPAIKKRPPDARNKKGITCRKRFTYIEESSELKADSKHTE